MLHRPRSKERATGLPGPSFMSNEQVGNYLRDIRTNRPARPAGSRPPPPSSISSYRSKANATPTPESPTSPISPTAEPPRCHSALSYRDVSGSGSSIRSFANRASAVLGRPLVQDPINRAPSRSSFVQDPATIDRSSSRNSTRSTEQQKSMYREDKLRWTERHEAHSLRQALEDVDMKKEREVFTAAQDEAAELVWKHRNPNTPFRNPDAPYGYTAPLRRGSHARAQSFDAHSHHSSGRNSALSSHGSSSSSVKVHDAVTAEPEQKPKLQREKPAEKTKAMEKGSGSKGHVSFDVPPTRRRSSGSRRKGSGSLFENPNDKIYEEPEEPSPPKPAEEKPSTQYPSKLPIHSRRNPFSRVQFSKDNLGRSHTDPQIAKQKLDKFEIYRNPPSQSRNPAYTSNADQPVMTPEKSAETTTRPSVLEEQAVEDFKLKDGKEVRNDDIRAATSMRLRDRSPKLPTPTMVSDSPGRPIVSFQKDYKPKEIELKEEQSKSIPAIQLPEETAQPKANPPSPTKRGSMGPPPIPIINVPDSPKAKPQSSAARPIPTIAVSETSIPSISIFDSAPPSINVSSAPPHSSPSTRPSPPSTHPPQTPHDPSQILNPRPKAAPSPRHSNTAPSSLQNTSHWTPSGGARTSALCEQCALPIAGRIVSAAGARFHPECFVCYHCGEALECVAFYPEPKGKREERVNRIRRRLDGEDVAIVEGESEQDDGDEGLRFYCHLDFHEFFSPRCKSCKTPIEGEVIVACGAEWHVGHFFCAECGDPFDSSTPFVEKDGYAWCVNCHTNRYSTKCKKCRRPVTDTVLKALGSEWHPQCFVCMECSGPFEDGRYFLRGESKDPVCVRCEERRLKA